MRFSVRRLKIFGIMCFLATFYLGYQSRSIAGSNIHINVPVIYHEESHGKLQPAKMNHSMETSTSVLETNLRNLKVERLLTRLKTLQNTYAKERNPDLTYPSLSTTECDSVKYREYQEAAATKHYVIPDILGHAQYIPEGAVAISLIAHMTDDRLDKFERILEYWDGPVSVALYLDMDNARGTLERILQNSNIQERQNVLIHVVPSQGTIYPVNTLRNMALNNTQTMYVFLTDIDFIPLFGAHDVLLEDLVRTDDTNQKRVFVVPAFEEKKPGQYTFPELKSDMKKLMDKGIVTPFHFQSFATGHKRTDFPKWLTADMPYKIKWEPFFEPYIVGNRKQLPLYSQKFVGRGFNKSQQIAETVAMGFELFVHPQVALIHLKHSSRQGTQSDIQAKYEKCSRKLMEEEFNMYLLKTYKFDARW